MKQFRKGLLVVGLAMLLAFPLGAQQIAPHIGYVYPAGGRTGTTFQVKIGGQFLDGATNAHLSGGGARISVLDHFKPLTQAQFNNLREKLKELQDKRAATMENRRKRAGAQIAGSTNTTWTVEDEKTFAELRKKFSTFQRRPANPAIAEIVTVEVALAADAEPGERELRLTTQLGLSNPLVFCVGQLPEFSKKLPVTPNVSRFGQAARNDPPSTPVTEMAISLPAVVNGQTMPGGVDRYRFQARKDQQLVLAASARALIPYLSDAVPGWFQASLALYDSKGAELAFADHYRFHPDPVLYCVIPQDGEYVVQIRDSIYRGREDFVYRIAIGELPFLTSIFPLGGPVGSETAVALEGWNLPASMQIQEARNSAPGIFPLQVSKQGLRSNPLPFAVDTLPEILEQEPNNTTNNAQPVTLPVIINGRIAAAGDVDIFRFEGRAGEQMVAEIYARRLGSPLDSVLKLTDASGRQLAFNDDYEDKGSGLNTHHADSYVRAALTNTGTYFLQVSDAQRQGGAECSYRLRLSAPQPDFALRVVPSSINVRGGASVPLTVYALRRDGFSNEIAVTLKDAPPGFTLSGGIVPANQDQVRVTLSAPPRPQAEPFSLSMEGRAQVRGRTIIHPAVPAEDMMQAFAYRHLVPAKELLASVSGRFMGRAAPKILGNMPVKIPMGGTVRVRIATPRGPFADRAQLELSEPPEGITLGNISATAEGVELTVRSDMAKTKPGLQGNLIVNVFPRLVASAQKAKKQTNQRRPSIGVLPAIPFEVVAQ
jgi:Bacterial pre-peptidase C-terminal domain